MGTLALPDQACKKFSFQTVKANLKIRAAKQEDTKQEKADERVAGQWLNAPVLEMV